MDQPQTPRPQLSEAERAKRDHDRKMPRQRKPQSEEEFAAQQELYATGPPVQDDNTLLERDWSQADLNDKIERAQLRYAAERAYYLRQYQQALDILSAADKYNLHARDSKELDTIRDACKRHIVE